MKPLTHGPEEEEARLARQLLSPLAEDTGASWTPARSASVWQQIEARREARPPWPRLALPLALASAACVALVALWPGAQPTATPSHGAASGLAERVSEAPTEPRLALAHTGDAISADRRLPSGAKLTVTGEVLVARAEAAHTLLDLERGAVRSDVPPIPPGGSYVVRTPEATVHVKGTIFTVRRGPEGETSVSVTEGRVEVHPLNGDPMVVLTAGQRHRVPSRLAPADPAEVLERQNAAIAEGRRLSGQDAAAAASHWGEVLTTWPEGPHAEEAMYRLARALHEAGRAAEAAEVARRFQARFPESPYGRALSPLLQ